MDELDNMNIIEQIGMFCSDIENEVLIYDDYVSNNLIKSTQKILSFINAAPNEIKNLVEEKMHETTLKSGKYAKVWLYSAVLRINYNPVILEELLEFLIREDNFSPNVRHFLFYQIKNTLFNHICLDNEKTKFLIWKLFDKTVEAFKSNLIDVLHPISFEQRDADTVLVITEQILEEEHGPTKTAFDRCKVLIRNMGKKVLLLNTSEIASTVGIIPYYGAVKGQQNDDLLSNLDSRKRDEVKLSTA